MSGFDQLHMQLRDVVSRRAELNQPTPMHRRVARFLREWPLVVAVGVSIAVMAIALSWLHPAERDTTATGARPGHPLVIGSGPGPVTAPRCPSSVQPVRCLIVLVRMTALPSVGSGVRNPTVVTARGTLTAFTLGIGKLSDNARTRAADVTYLDELDGSPQAVITVLARAGTARSERWVVAANSPPVALQHDLGKVVRFRLAKPLPLAVGEAIALTVPTWAPVLSIGPAGHGYAYRQSLSNQCHGASMHGAAQIKLGQHATYRCSHAGTRVEFSATEQATPSG